MRTRRSDHPFHLRSLPAGNDLAPGFRVRSWSPLSAARRAAAWPRWLPVLLASGGLLAEILPPASRRAFGSVEVSETRVAAKADVSGNSSGTADATTSGIDSSGIDSAGLDAASGMSAEVPIAALIEQLGASEYAARQKAQEALSRRGIHAFDALHAALEHPDAEVRQQAEYLFRSIRIAWVRDGDSVGVQKILRNYRQEDDESREVRLAQLAQLPASEGLGPLCRLARFETSEDLARLAALRIMRTSLPRSPWSTEEVMPAGQLAELVRVTIGDSPRVSSQWLRTFAQHLDDPASTADAWRMLMDAGDAELKQRRDPVRQRVHAEFLRWQVVSSRQAGREDHGLAVMRRLLEHQGESREDLLSTANWLLDSSAFPLMDPLVERFPQPFAEDPHLMYRRAESLARQEKRDEAEALVAKALQAQLPERPFLHVELGMDQQNRGMLEWAEREYRSVARPTDPPTHPPLEAMIRLGWMFHDQGRDRDAYEAFKMAVDWMERDKSVVRMVQELSKIPMQIRSQMHFSHSQALAVEKKFAEQREQLELALRHDQNNADILIAMHRAEQTDDVWQAQTAERVRRLREHYRAQIAAANAQFSTLQSDEEIRYLAMQHNQYAWLVANTTGDYQSALESSLRSLELAPNEAGYLDTLARCYYALGNLEQATRQQRRAVELEPHSGMIQRQLKFLEEKLAESRR